MLRSRSVLALVVACAFSCAGSVLLDAATPNKQSDTIQTSRGELMKALKNITIAFLAMNPPRTMSTKEAADCAKAFRPRIVYAYHYRGSKPEEFANGLKDVPGVEVRLRKLEGEP